MNQSQTESDQSLLEEIEVLKSILFSELDVTYTENGRPTQLSTTLYPSTADDANQQYVCLTLNMKFPPKYPDESPIIEFRNPRGLGEDFLGSVSKQCQEKCVQFSGCPVIYEVIELIRESLTNSNKPTGHCTICLFEFHSEDVFTYTLCYHHFHSHCLSRFCENLQRQWKEEEDQEAAHNPNAALMKEKKPKNFSCPVCREVINVDLDMLRQAPPPYEVRHFTEEFQPDDKFKTWKKEMEEEYEKQKAKGGIIDREANDNRFLVVTDIPSNSSPSELSSSPSSDDQPQQLEASQPRQTKELQPATKQAPASANPHHRHPRTHKNYHHDHRQHHDQDFKQHDGQKRLPNQNRPQHKTQQFSRDRTYGQEKPKREPLDKSKPVMQQTAQSEPSKPIHEISKEAQESMSEQLQIQPQQAQSNQRNQRPRQRNHQRRRDCAGNIDKQQERPRHQRETNHSNGRSEAHNGLAVSNRPNVQQETSVHAEQSAARGQSLPRPRPPPGFTPR